MKNIYIDSNQIHSNTDNTIGIFVKPDISGLEQPEIRLPSFNRPNVDGAVVPNQLYGGRLISLQGRVFADDIATYRTRRLSLESAVNIKRDILGSLSALTLKFLTMDDLALQIDVYTRKFSMPDKYMTHADFSLDLFAPDLYLLSQIVKSSILYPFSGGGMAIPMAIPMPFNANASNDSILNNAGNVDAHTTIQINGPMTDPTLVNITKDQTLNIDYTLGSGEFIVIDSINRTVLHYASLGAEPTNIRDLITGDFITLASGNNVIKLILGGYTTTGNIQINWRDSYSGI